MEILEFGDLTLAAWLVTLLALGMTPEIEGNKSQGTCRLSGSYSLMMVDDEGSGWVYNRKNEIRGGNINWQRAGIDGVELLQVSGKYIL